MLPTLISWLRRNFATGDDIPDSAKRKAGVPSAQTAGPREAATLVDAHLVMNSLNQLAAYIHAKTGVEEPRLFALADYLRAVFQSGTEDVIHLDQEAGLLHNFLQLAAKNRAAEFPLELIPGIVEKDSVLVQRHLSCDLVAIAIRVLPTESIKNGPLRVSLEWRPRPEAYTLRISATCDDYAAVSERLGNEAMVFLERFGAVTSAAIKFNFYHVNGACVWETRVPRVEVNT